MSIRTRIAEWIAGSERRSTSSWDLLAAHRGGFGSDPFSGEVVTPWSAEHSIAAVYACVTAISSAISALPLFVYRRTADGRTVDENHPLMRLVREGPNQFQAWPDYIETIVASVLLRGNALSHVVTNGAGQLEELIPIPWDITSLVQLPRGGIAYDVSVPRTGRTFRLLQGEVFHLKDRAGDDETFGISRIARAAGSIAQQQALAHFSGSSWKNGVNPSGVITQPGNVKLTETSKKQLQEAFTQAFAGTTNAGKALLLEGGLDWKSISVTPHDAQLIESRQFSVIEIARLFNVPPPIIQDYSNNTFTNAGQANAWFGTLTLTPWVRKLEGEITRSVFTESERRSHIVEFDMTALLRGDPQVRWESHKIAVESGILTPNEIRDIEGFDPRPGGDEVATNAALGAAGV